MNFYMLLQFSVNYSLEHLSYGNDFGFGTGAYCRIRDSYVFRHHSRKSYYLLGGFLGIPGIVDCGVSFSAEVVSLVLIPCQLLGTFV